MPIPREQLRLTPDELDDLMGAAREAHVATVSADGWPHVVPLWFVWRDRTVWVNSLRKSKRAHDLAAGSKVSICVDAGEEYAELRGATFYGTFAEITDPGLLDDIMKRFSVKYWGGIDIPTLPSHVWLRLELEKIVTWDFRKIPSGRDRRLEATRGPKD